MVVYYALFVFPITALVSFLLYFPFACRFRRDGKRGLLFHLPRYAMIGYLLSLIYLTLLFYYPDIEIFPGYYFLNLRPFVWVTQVYDMGLETMLWQLAMNIVMFIPWGFLLPVVFPGQRKFSSTVLTVFLTTFTIEALQLCMGRSADIDDVIMNTFGGVLGYSLFALLNRTFKNHPSWNKILRA